MDRAKRHFSGTVTIHGNSRQETTSIQLHAHRLHILSATIDGQEAACEHDENDVLTLRASTSRPGKHEVTIQFEGKITKSMHGLYPCYFKTKADEFELLATQFESHHAREVFPCIDEPEAKATFDLTLETEPGVTTLSNTPVKRQLEQAGILTTTFETTPLMSTYLLAWVVGPLDYQEAKTKDGLTVRAYATPDKKDQLGYAVNETVRCLEFFNDYFGIPYPLAKCDLVALPDFSAGAMENWGLINFRETYLLAQNSTSTRAKQWIVMVIAHELAHQWFGNLVTMKWWNDLWLNESFANWMEYFGTAQLHPEWDMWTQYYQDETASAIERDSLASVQRIQQDVHTPEEINALFDPAIVYAKGGSLINMLHAHIGPDAFRDGLHVYLQRHQYANTEANDLWQALGETSGRNVLEFMQPWIDQAGLPVVTVGLSDRNVNLHQRRFFSNPRQASGNQQTVWPIPLLATAHLNNQLLEHASASLPLDALDRPFMLNNGRTGYYLTLYSSDHVATLAAEIKANRLPVIDRLGLLSDSLNLSRAGLQPQLASLQLLEAYRDESAQPVWNAIGSHLDALKMFADDDEELLAALRQFIHDLALSQYQRLGWQPAINEAYLDTLLRPIILSHMTYAEDAEVLSHLSEIFRKAHDPADIAGDVRTIVCTAAACFGDETDFEKLLDWHNRATSAEHRGQIIAGLCAARRPQAITRILGILTTESVRLQDLFYWVRYLTANRYARMQTWQWLQENWQWITDHFGNDLHYTSFPKYAASAFSTPQELTSYHDFFQPLLETPGIGRAIQQGIEDIEVRLAWRQRDGQAVATYIQSHHNKFA